MEPGITTEPMCRLRRQKLEVVVPASQGEKYRPVEETVTAADETDEVDEPDEPDDSEAEEETTGRGKKTKVEWIEAIPPDRFYLRVGLGRKASGSYYTPHSFVRFLVQETLGPQVAERSPADNPQPLQILGLKVLDPAMGSGHFLVEACRYLGDKLYEACRLCDDLALAAEKRSETAKDDAQRQQAVAQAVELRQRIIDLPDPDDELLRYLPSRVVEGGATGLSHDRAVALCRRLVATHCLYGVDKNPLAVELAKLALWLESHAEGMPLTFLDHRFVVGDSLTGPFWEKLLYKPGRPEEKLEMAWHRSLENNLRGALFDALKHVKRLEASVGATVAEMREKEQAKRDLDDALIPFRVAAAAWSGGVMLGPEKCDDVAYADLLQTISSARELPATIESPALLAMIARGLGCEAVPADASSLTALVASGRCDPALPYDLMFPEVFYPNGVVHSRQGFQAVLGNPPWDRLRPLVKEFLAGLDISIVGEASKRERDRIEQALRESSKTAFEQYVETFEQIGRVHDERFAWQSVKVGDIWAGRGNADAYCLFAEAAVQLLNPRGYVGLVLPSAFHANEGATGVRMLFLDKLNLQQCFSFENRKGIFDIHKSFKFACVVAATSSAPTQRFSCAFYLENDEWLFAESKSPKPLSYTRSFVDQTGGAYLTFLEIVSDADATIATTCFANSISLKEWLANNRMEFGVQADMTRDAWRFTPVEKVFARGADVRTPSVHHLSIEKGYLVLHEGKTFYQYDDKWDSLPSSLCSVHDLLDKPGWLESARHFRLAYRGIARSTDERTSIFAVLPPGIVAGNSAPVERTAPNTPRAQSLQLCAIVDSFCFDWTLRIRAAANVNQFILYSCPVPATGIFGERLLTHSALRLVCNHAGYAPLWQDQLADAWREPEEEPSTWPVLAGDVKRWSVRAAIDAVVADAYGLSRVQYAHVLSTFSHNSFRRAPEICLTAFDELKQLGIEAFTKKHDPYWDIPLNENLPQPVIDLPIPSDDTKPIASGQWQEKTGQHTFLSPGPLFDQQPNAEVNAPKPAPKKRGRPKK